MVRTSFLLAFLGLASVAVAQDGGIESALQKAATASPEEMRGFATSSVATIKENAKSVGRMLEAASSKGEPGLVKCLTPKNTSAQALVQVTELSAGNLTRALDTGGDDGTAKARHEYRKIAVSSNKSDTILAEANQCQDGGADGEKGGSVVWEGGVGEDGEDVDNGVINDLDIQIDAPVVSPFAP